jgi:hypothetical protein
MSGKTRSMAAALPSSRLNPDQLLAEPADQPGTIIAYLQQLDREQKPSIHSAWLRLFDACEWKNNPPPELLALAPLLIGSNEGDRQRLARLALAQYLTWVLPTAMLRRSKQRDLAAKLVADPRSLPRVAAEVGGRLGSAAGGNSLPPRWFRLIVVRDAMYVSSGQVDGEISELLESADQLQADIAALSASNRQGDWQKIDIQQLFDDIRAQLLNFLPRALAFRDADRGLLLPYSQLGLKG